MELGTESIPCCVLQIIVWLEKPDQAGDFALVSILASVLTTSYVSAMISYDMDLDVPRRKNDPRFYGYIPDSHGPRGRCFFLMTIMSALHNLSRSIGCALLLSASGSVMAVYFIVGELVLYFVYKVARRDFMYQLPIEGLWGVLISLLVRVVGKIVVDFSGCLHFR